MSNLSSRHFKVVLARSSCSSGESSAARRVIMNALVLNAEKVCSGDVVAVSAADRTNMEAFAVGIAWPSLEVAEDDILVNSSILLTACTVEGARVHVFPLSGPASTNQKLPNGLPLISQIQEARSIQLKEITSPPPRTRPSVAPQTGQTRRDMLPLALKEALVHLRYLTGTQTVELGYEGHIRRFTACSISAPPKSSRAVNNAEPTLHTVEKDPPHRLWIVGWDTVVTVSSDDVLSDINKSLETLTLESTPDPYSSVGGLDKQIAQIRDLIEIPLTQPELFRYFGLKPPRGILLHGPPGTGKTHLARAIAASTKSTVLVLNGPELSSAYHGETEAKLRGVFKEAREKSPSIVVLDEVDALFPKRDEGGGEVEKRVVATLLTILDGMEDEGGRDQSENRVVVIGTTNRPNAIDPALRRPGRFDREIEIGVPDADARLSILRVLLSKTPHSLQEADIRSIASLAYGYVGADLNAMVHEAGIIAIKRYLSLVPSLLPLPSPVITQPDLLASLATIRPSAMRSLFFETPPVRYTDIGGQASVIQKLRETVEWPLLHPEVFKRLGARPPKGVLLYGPPGCSKTILVRACACESGINFVAVKGPELLHKFLGESERAVREIFRRARMASPSIVFFDEIDALATSRSSGDSEGGPGSSEGVLTMLLNEMDGVQELVGVTVVAATNRPDAIDSALMRPGRLDRLLYVGPPDQSGREEILRIRMSRMSVDPAVDVEEIARASEGCSGAEIVAICQEAALLTMQKDMDASHVPHDAFMFTATAMKRQITPEVMQKFERWHGGA